MQGPPTQSKPTDSPVRVGPSIAETNRKALEAGAGKDAAKLLLRSVPSQATIYIDGMNVGDTPLLLIIRPGKHKVEMHGQSEEFGERLIDLSPNETEEVALTLTLRYPASISVNPAASPSSATNFVTVTGAPLVPTSQSVEENTTQDPAVLRDSVLAETNRKALEQGAGKDAAKLMLKSAPADAMIYIDGMFVGRAPQLVTLSPGKHKVEMRGQRGEFGERLVGLLPNETQQLTLTLTIRYPAKISVR
ncbi:MAG TPA: PEGA domain-containing protein [Candidatus Acidoferrales bacterium]|nr:PEGA domain-containing protein [Candidatus Acidoferrales bacterium]